MNKRSTTRLGITVTATFLMALGSAMVIPAVASATPATAVEVSTSTAPHPMMWIDCTQLSWWERIWDSYC
ncbi:hypothetical protein ACU61A_26930 [Pseudonocardia sichuanensis]